MRKIFFCFVFFFGCTSGDLKAQTIRYSPNRNEDFTGAIEILGKVGGNYLVYKNFGWKNVIQVFDSRMNEISNNRIKFMPDNTFNVDFVVYPDHFLMVYQYKKNGQVYCDAIKMNSEGKPMGRPGRLDSTRILNTSLVVSYRTIHSEDKQKLLVYKKHEQLQSFTLLTKLYNRHLDLLDVTSYDWPLSGKREIFSALQLANNGTIFYTRESGGRNDEITNKLELITVLPQGGAINITPVQLGNRYIDRVNGKVDNIKNSYVINAIYTDHPRVGVQYGLFSAKVSIGDFSVKTFFIKAETKEQNKRSGGNSPINLSKFFIREVYIRNDGGFLVMAEDQDRFLPGHKSSWVRPASSGGFSLVNADLYNRVTKTTNSPHLHIQPAPIPGQSRIATVGQGPGVPDANVLLISLDDSLSPRWLHPLTIEPGERFGLYRSFGAMINPEGIQLLFNHESSSEVLQRIAISPAGNISRFPTLKGGEKGRRFLPGRSKQVSATQLLMTCAYRGRLCFALVEF